MSIEIRNVSKTFGAFRALNQINLDIHSGELVALPESWRAVDAPEGQVRLDQKVHHALR